MGQSEADEFYCIECQSLSESDRNRQAPVKRVIIEVININCCGRYVTPLID